jgi:hypothetical protein
VRWVDVVAATSPLGEPLRGPGDAFELRLEVKPDPAVASCLAHGSVLRHGPARRARGR